MNTSHNIHLDSSYEPATNRWDVSRRELDNSHALKIGARGSESSYDGVEFTLFGNESQINEQLDALIDAAMKAREEWLLGPEATQAIYDCEEALGRPHSEVAS